MSNKKDSSGMANIATKMITYGIGAFIGVFIIRVIKAIIFSLIFSIRHKDWRICIYPTWIFISIYFLIIPPIPEINFYIKFFLQIFTGLISYLIVKQNKLSIKLAN